MRKLLIFAFKLVVTVGLLALLLSVVDVRNLLYQASTVSVIALGVAAICYVLATLIATVRWSWLLGIQGISLPFLSLVSYNLSYSFYSMILPGGKVSAEALRIYQILKDTGHPEIREKIILPTLLDRLMMVFSSSVVAIIYFLFNANQIHATLPWWFTYSVLGVVVILLASIFIPYERMFSFDKKEELAPRASFIVSLRRALRLFRGHISILLSSFFASLLVNVFLALAFYTVALSLNVAPSFITVFAILTVGMLATVIPITIGGIGAREGVVAVLLSFATGMAIETSVTISLVTLATSLVIVVCGAGVEFYRHFIRHESA